MWINPTNDFSFEEFFCCLLFKLKLSIKGLKRSRYEITVIMQIQLEELSRSPVLARGKVRRF